MEAGLFLGAFPGAKVECALQLHVSAFPKTI